MRQNTNSKCEGIGLLANRSGVEQVTVASLLNYSKSPKKFSKDDIARATSFVDRFADHIMPVMIGNHSEILVGEVIVEAARRLGIKELRVVRQDGLGEPEQLLFSVAASKLLEFGSWDGTTMEAALRDFEAHITDFSHDLIGFGPGELDKLVGRSGANDLEDVVPKVAATPVSKVGSLWLAAKNRILCGDAKDASTLARLMNGCAAAAAVVDPPFGIKINGIVAKRGAHREFVETSGEKTDEELLDFFVEVCRALHDALRPGALVYLFIDWRSLHLLLRAGEAIFGKLINLCVWSKDRAGMGSFYRSQHELVLVFRKPGAPHRNNIELGRHGRNRSNIWAYPCAASSRTGREADMLKHHPTPKSVEMIADAILDCSLPGEVIIDTFLGSGTALIAAQRTGRICFGMDLDPLYVDLAIRRWQDWTGEAAIDAETSRTFNEMARDPDTGGSVDE